MSHNTVLSANYSSHQNPFTSKKIKRGVEIQEDLRYKLYIYQAMSFRI